MRSMWRPDVELTWEELPLQERNGIIRSYKLSYWVDPESITGTWTPTNSSLMPSTGNPKNYTS